MNWDVYWGKKQNKVYAYLASIYRAVFIRPMLNHFINKHFNVQDKLLHAGCGSGQVDQDIRSRFFIAPLDMSEAALLLYKDNNRLSDPVLGDIRKIPFKKDRFDGVYNLGVMEHMSEKDILHTLSEFHRVLKPNGKVVIFMPTKKSSTVFVLKIVQKVLKVKLHPPEPSLLKSKEWINRMLQYTGFKLIDYYFGPRDLWCQAVVVAEKFK